MVLWQIVGQEICEAACVIVSSHCKLVCLPTIFFDTDLKKQCDAACATTKGFCTDGCVIVSHCNPCDNNGS